MKFVSQKRTEYEGFIRGNIFFQDGSILHWPEYVDVEYGIERDMYSYEYMDASKRLIFRQDNAEHHHKLNLANFPHHKHEGSENNIVSANTPTLEDVLREIEREHFTFALASPLGLVCVAAPLGVRRQIYEIEMLPIEILLSQRILTGEGDSQGGANFATLTGYNNNAIARF